MRGSPFTRCPGSGGTGGGERGRGPPVSPASGLGVLGHPGGAGAICPGGQGQTWQGGAACCQGKEGGGLFCSPQSTPSWQQEGGGL